MRILLTIILSFSINIFGDDHMSQKEMNLKVVNTFWDNILTENYQVALDTLHEDLEFEFMGICSICKKYKRQDLRNIFKKSDGIKFDKEFKLAFKKCKL